MIVTTEAIVLRARKQGERLLAGLNDAVSAAGLSDPARGLGLLVGAPAGAGRSRAVIDGLMARGFLATEAGGGVIRATPPLTVDADSVDGFVTAFGEALVEAGDPL